MKVNIESACHEKWQNMDPTKKGKFCASCKKEVLDLSSMSNQELRKLHFNADPNLCGRLSLSQVDKSLGKDTLFSFQKTTLATALTLLGLASAVHAQDNGHRQKSLEYKLQECISPDAIQSPQQQQRTAQKLLDTLVTIQGKVTDFDTHEPLPFVNVYTQKESGVVGGTSDLDGNFSLTLRTTHPLTLHFSYVGYSKTQLDLTETVRAALSAKQDTIEVDLDLTKMQTSTMVMGSMVYIPETSAEKLKHRVRKSWWKTKNFFSRLFH